MPVPTAFPLRHTHTRTEAEQLLLGHTNRTLLSEIQLLKGTLALYGPPRSKEELSASSSPTFSFSQPVQPATVVVLRRRQFFEPHFFPLIIQRNLCAKRGWGGKYRLDIELWFLVLICFFKCPINTLG